MFEHEDGYRYQLWVTNLPAATKGLAGQNAYIDAAHRVHARVEDAIRTGKETGLGRFPSHDYALNQAWLTAAMIAQILLAWLKLLALDGDLAKAEPKTLRYRVLHAAARLVRGGRRRRWKIAAQLALGRGDHPGLAAHLRTAGHLLTSTNPSLRPGKEPRGLWNPRPPGPPAGPPSYPSTKIQVQNAAPRSSSASHQRKHSAHSRVVMGSAGCGWGYGENACAGGRQGLPSMRSCRTSMAFCRACGRCRCSCGCRGGPG